MKSNLFYLNYYLNWLENIIKKQIFFELKINNIFFCHLGNLLAALGLIYSIEAYLKANPNMWIKRKDAL
jgi:hypothetical protein